MRTTAIILAALVLAIAGCGGGGDKKKDEPDAGATPVAPQDNADQQTQASGCKKVGPPAAKPDGGATKPKDELDPGKTYKLNVTTSCGAFTIELDQKGSPNAAASLVALARDGFFDGTTFHRIVPGFVIQGGDPTGSGSGGPGYSTEDTPPADAAYTKGVVAMAKTEVEPPGTAGSQFYVVSGDDAGLPPDYAIVGEVTEGIDVVEKIDKLGDPASGGTGTPLQPVVIEKVEVEEG